jgi:long-chain fatty acid transport protein
VTDSSKRLAWIPNVYLVKEISPRLRLGTGINSPFGSVTEYQPGWVGRYQALKSKIETVNVNPSLSYLVNDAVSVGAGLDYQRARAEFTNAKNFGVGDGMVTMSGNDAAWGYNLGVLFKRNSGERIGLTYRSSIQYRMKGAVLVTNAAGAVAINQAATADLKVPDSWSLSYFRALDGKWDVMAELTHTGWGCFNELRVVQVSNGATLALTPENWRNTWRLALGANHHYSAQWTARVGLAYDQSPVPDTFRTPRLPDSDRTMLALGGQYRFDKGGVLDFGYAHLFVKDSTINKFVDTASAQIVGSYSSQADVLSVQYSHRF